MVEVGGGGVVFSHVQLCLGPREIPGGMVWEAYVPGEIPNSACL